MSDENDLVLDPFLGVGSTVVAAVLNGRKGVGSEIVEDYYNWAVERVESALQGALRVREDKPVYVPPENLSLSKNPWVRDNQVKLWK